MRRFLVSIMAATLLAACTEQVDPVDQHPLAVESPIHGSARPPLDVQEVRVQISRGQFTADIYCAQVGPTVLLVTSMDGEHTLSIQALVASASLPPGATTRVSFTAPQPGEYLMRLDASGDTAVLNVRPVGAARRVAFSGSVLLGGVSSLPMPAVRPAPGPPPSLVARPAGRSSKIPRPS